MEQNRQKYILAELRELPIGNQVLVHSKTHGELWVSLGRTFAVGIIPGDAALTFYAHNGLQTVQFEYCDYGDGWVAYKAKAQGWKMNEAKKIKIVGEEHPKLPNPVSRGVCHDCGRPVGTPHAPECWFAPCPLCGGMGGTTYCDCKNTGISYPRFPDDREAII